MAKIIKVKVTVVLDNMDTFLNESEHSLDGQAYGSDLAEVTIEIASQVVSDVVKKIVDEHNSCA